MSKVFKRRVGNAIDREPLDSMSHDDVFVLDANLVICYTQQTIPAWNKFADEHLALGKKFYMIEMNFEELEDGHPDWCEVIKTDQPITIAGMEPFYNRVLEKFDVQGKMKLKLKVSNVVCASLC